LSKSPGPARVACMGYSNECTHGGPAIDLVEDALGILEAFQTKVFQTKLFDLPPEQKAVKQEQYTADIQVLLKLLRRPEFERLISSDVARVFLSEAVDCNERGEGIALAWFCTALLIGALSTGAVQGEDLPAIVRERADEALKNVAYAIWRWTPCDCATAESSELDLPWAAPKLAAAELVKIKNWPDAISCYEILLASLVEAREKELALQAACCFSSRGPLGLPGIDTERARILSNISFCQLATGQAEAALSSAVAATEADPKFAKAYARQVVALEALGRPAHAAARAAVRCARASGEDGVAYLEMLARHPTEQPAAGGQ